MVYDDFLEYKRLGEPEMAGKSGIWQAAIGLQQVDGLRENPRLTARELAEFFSVDEKTVKRDFAFLKAQGKIRRIGSNKAGHRESLF